MKKPSDHTNIGFAAWGTKRGPKVFFANPYIDVKSTAIQQTLKDIQSVIRFQDPEIEFYSIEHTNKYRVYTLYRTVYDWTNSPGYLALTLYIPHDVSLDFDVLTILHDLKDLYVSRYMDASYRISKNPENRALFFDCIPTDVSSTPDLQRKASPQNNIHGSIFYKNESDLRKHFKEAYHTAYSQYQRILFFQKDINGVFDSLTPVTLGKDTAAKSILVTPTPVIEQKHTPIRKAPKLSPPTPVVKPKEKTSKTSPVLATVPLAKPLDKTIKPNKVVHQKTTRTTKKTFQQANWLDQNGLLLATILAGIVFASFAGWYFFSPSTPTLSPISSEIVSPPSNTGKEDRPVIETLQLIQEEINDIQQYANATDYTAVTIDAKLTYLQKKEVQDRSAILLFNDIIMGNGEYIPDGNIAMLTKRLMVMKGYGRYRFLYRNAKTAKEKLEYTAEIKNICIGASLSSVQEQDMKLWLTQNVGEAWKTNEYLGENEENITSPTSPGVAKKIAEELANIQGQIDKIQDFANKTDFRRKPIESNQRKLKSEKIKKAVAQLTFDKLIAANGNYLRKKNKFAIQERLKNMKLLGRAMHEYDHFEEIDEGNRKSFGYEYIDEVKNLLKKKSYSKAQHAFVQKWLKKNE